MYPSLKDVSIACNLNQKQHTMFMLVGRVLRNSYDNLTPTEPFFAWLGGDPGTSMNCVIQVLLTLTSIW
jgi:hypothetical protein